ncbi:hypothetical protein BH10PLA1_BH10PLA1_13780 [soil metagenome]
MRRALLTLLLPAVCMAGSGAVPSTQPALPIEPQVQALINDLGDLRSAVREDATKKLIDRGSAIRAALVEASKSDDPEVAARAVMIMRSWPWDRPNDPLKVKALLSRYKTLGRDQRPSMIGQLLNLPNNQGLEAVMRLLQEETDAHMRWSIVRVMRFMWTRQGTSVSPDITAARRDAAKKLDTTADDAPVLALAAAAWTVDNPQRSTTLYIRAARACDPSASPGQDQTEIDFVFNSAMTALWTAKRYDEFAGLLRLKAERPNPTLIAGVPEPVCDLFALHAKVGPLAGYAEDCRQYADLLLRPPLLYAQSYRAYREGHPIVAKALGELAFMGSGDDPLVHRAVGEFLQANQWRQPAVNEIQAYLALTKPDESLDSKTEVANAHLMLGLIHGSADEHLLAAKELEQGLAILEPLSAVLSRTRDGRTISGDDAKRDMQAEMQGHYLEDALERNDQTEVAKRIELLKGLSPTDPEVVQEMVAYLTKAGDTHTADKLFSPIEQQLNLRLSQEPTGQSKNSLAWFYARSGRHLDRAKQLAEQAVGGDPGNAAFIDTLAEVHFQMGEVDEAIKIEQTALAAEPGRPEIEAQLRRFQKAKKK